MCNSEAAHIAIEALLQCDGCLRGFPIAKNFQASALLELRPLLDSKAQGVGEIRDWNRHLPENRRVRPLDLARFSASQREILYLSCPLLKGHSACTYRGSCSSRFFRALFPSGRAGVSSFAILSIAAI